MATKFDLNDDGAVVVVGSGAGGGTLGSELAMKGVKTVILEAGGRHEINDFVNDEWGMVGKNYMRHMTGSVYAVFDKPVHMYRGTTMAGIISDESIYDPSRGFVGGYEMETLSLGLPFMGAFLDPDSWGREFASAMEGYENTAGMCLVGEDMPQESNSITLRSVQPAPSQRRPTRQRIILAPIE